MATTIQYREAYLESYKEEKVFIPFLSTFFRTRPSDIVDAESVKIDIMRKGRRLAPVISSMSGNGSRRKSSQYTNKQFTPPVVGERADFHNADLISKAFGKDEYSSSNVSYMMQLQDNIMNVMQEIEKEIYRTIEYQASQILTRAGGLSLYDENGVVAYTLDFQVKAAHFPTVSTSWSDANAAPDDDIIALYDLIKQASGADAKNLIFGKTAWKNYVGNTKIQDKFDIRRIDPLTIKMREQSTDVKLMGEFQIENQIFVAWIYDGYYEDPANSYAVTPFVPADKVIMIPDPGSANTDFRKVYCTVPSISKAMGRDLGIVPTNLALDNRSYTARTWLDENGDQLNTELKTRPLLIPVSIDSFGCIDTEI
jgi:hypothetical protein